MIFLNLEAVIKNSVGRRLSKRLVLDKINGGASLNCLGSVFLIIHAFSLSLAIVLFIECGYFG